MRLAVLIGVSQYKDPADNLPACRADVALINAILGVTKLYDDRLVLVDDTSSQAIKSQVAEFVSKYKGQVIEEVFFYYTGHGGLIADEFYFIPSDFDESKLRSTGLSNSEVDAWLRVLKADVTVKVVDACHAAVPYVKDVGDVQKALVVASGKFNKCYFMFSSKAEQVSFQNERLSYFTRAFADSIASVELGNVRYNTIADGIGDSFAGKGLQTPTFVFQADLTEVFAPASEEMHDVIGRLLSEGLDEGEAANEEQSSLVGRVKRDARRFTDLETAVGKMVEAREAVKNISVDKELLELYRVSVTNVEGDEVTNRKSVASYLYGRNRNPPFYKLSFDDDWIVVGPKTPDRTSNRVNVANDYTSLDGVPAWAVEIVLRPQYPNLPVWFLTAVPLVVSLSEFAVVYGLMGGGDGRRNVQQSAVSFSWKSANCDWGGDAAKLIMVRAFQEMLNHVKVWLLSQFSDTEAGHELPKPAAGDAASGGFA